jgi:hypothetical protein
VAVALAVLGLALPEISAAPTALSHHVRPPYAQTLWRYSTPFTARCSSLVGLPSGISLNATLGLFGLPGGLLATAKGCPNSTSLQSADELESAGFGFSLVAPSSGSVNISTTWNGSAWANASIVRNGTPLTFRGHSSLTATTTWSTSILVLSNSSGPGSTSITFSKRLGGVARTVGGSTSLRIRIHGASAQFSGLTAGQTYTVWALLSVHVEATSWHAHPGARAMAWANCAAVRLVQVYLT